MQVLYVSESVSLNLVEGQYQLVVKGKWNQEGVDRALNKCNLTLKDVQVIEDE